MAEGWIVCLLLIFLSRVDALPNPNVEEVEIADHVAGMPMERDGDLNTNVDAEMFLGRDLEEINDHTSAYDVNKIITNAFENADTNGDGYLSFYELRDWIKKKMEEHYTEAIGDEEENSRVFDDFDKNKDSKLTWEEYSGRLREHVRELIRTDNVEERDRFDENGKPLSLEEEIEKTLETTFERDKKRFDYSDGDGDDSLTPDEFIYFSHPEYNLRAVYGLAADLIKVLDEDGDNQLKDEEFVKYYKDHMERMSSGNQRNGAELIERWRGTFHRVIDTNGDGWADESEFAAFLNPKNEAHAEDEAHYLISKADMNNDGKLSLQEVLNHPDMFAGSSLTDGGYKMHWDEL